MRRDHVSMVAVAASMLMLVASLPAGAAGRSGARKPSSSPRATKKPPAAKTGGARPAVKPFDQPDEAARWDFERQSPDGKRVPIERLLPAMAQMKEMPRYATELSQRLPSWNEVERLGIADPARSPLVLNTWTWLGPGNVGGRTRTIVIHPTTPTTMWAAGPTGGVWKTTNGGGAWTPVSDLIANLAVCTLALDPGNPNVIYAGTGEGYFTSAGAQGLGIFKSVDGGTSWTQLANTANSDFYYVNKIVVSKNSSQRVYAATRTGIFLSTDAGTTWTQVYTANLTGGMMDLVARTDKATDYLYATQGTFTSTPDDAVILRNTDAAGGGTWDVVYTDANMGRTSLALAPSNQNVLYAMSAETSGASPFNNALHSIVRSTQSGDPGTFAVRVDTTGDTTNPAPLKYMIQGYTRGTCTAGTNDRSGQAWNNDVLAVDPLNPDRLWAGGIDLFLSTDGGLSWGQASHWDANKTAANYDHADHHALVFHPNYNGTTNQQLFVGNDGGISRIDNATNGTATTAQSAGCDRDSGIQFTGLNNGYGVTQFYDGTPYPNGQSYFGGAQDNGTVRGTDAGGIGGWTDVGGGDGGYVAVNPQNTDIIYFESQNGAIRRSTDGGDSSQSVRTGLTSDTFAFITPFVIDPNDPTRLFIGGRVPWRTINGADSWTQAGAAFSSNSRVSAIAVAPSDSNYVLMGMENSGNQNGTIFRTTAGTTSTAGTVWASVKPRSGAVSSLAFDPTNKDVAYATYATYGGSHVWKSTNAGATWASIDGTGGTGIPDIPAHSIEVDPANGQRLFLGTELGVFTSTDGGGTWLVENTGFANVRVEKLKVMGTTLWAFTFGRGVYKVTIGAGGGGGCTPDTTAPTVTAPNPTTITVNQSTCAGGVGIVTLATLQARDAAAGAQLNAFLNTTPSATDACSAATRLASRLGATDIVSTTAFAAGANTVTFRFSDASNNIGTATGTVQVRRQGDVDQSNVIDVFDVVTIQNFIVGNVVPGVAPFTAPTSKVADNDNSGTVDVFDVILEANFIVGNSTCLTP